MKNGDRPAFSSLHTIDGNWQKEPRKDYQGLTKREYFAAIAMQSMVAGEGARMVADRDMRYTGNNWKEVVAKNALEFADELLKQLES